MSGTDHTQVIAGIARLEGIVDGLTKVVVMQGEGHNRRIDDLHRHITDRMDQQDRNVAEIGRTAKAAMETAIEAKVTARRHGALGGVGASAVVGGLIEAIKALAGH